jgi:predicted RNA-binding protein YlqC (UPF0109 family)
MDIDKFIKILVTAFGEEIEPKVEISADEIISLEVNPEKLPFVIGKQGRNIKTVRELVYLYNKLNNANYVLKLVEPQSL